MQLAVPAMLYAKGDENQLVVYPSWVVRDTDDIYAPVREFIEQNRMVLGYRGMEPLPQAMGGEVEVTWWATKHVVADALLDEKLEKEKLCERERQAVAAGAFYGIALDVLFLRARAVDAPGTHPGDPRRRHADLLRERTG
jgi:hypothetical protein